MHWHLTHRADLSAAAIADRHYNRQSIGSRQFVPPGRCIVLITNDLKALWVTSWPFPQYVKHQYKDAWTCSLFRNEAPEIYLSSDLIREAVAVTRAIWRHIPRQGFITFVDHGKIKPKRDAGYCFLHAEWHRVGAMGSRPNRYLWKQPLCSHLPPLWLRWVEIMIEAVKRVNR
jgi:hypothetical protein